MPSEHFIPFRRTDLARMCQSDDRLDDCRRQQFGQFAELLAAIFHFEFHARLEHLKDLYAPLNPDADTLPGPLAAPAPAGSLVDALRATLQAANYVEITDDDLRQALREESLFRIRLEVDFDDFDEVLFFRRGERQREETLRGLLGLRQRRLRFTNYDRVLVYVRFRPSDHFRRRPDKQLPFQPGTILLKLFQNVPKADLEMLFPNTEIRMRTLDKLIIGVPTAIGSATMIATKLGGSLLAIGALLAFWLGLRAEPVSIDQAALIGLGAGLGTLAGFLWRQFSKFKNRKLHFMQSLTENLYFKNLDNNAGVLHHLIDAAEEEECKEAMLAYHALLLADAPLTETELDRRVETWLADQWQCRADFEVDDALAKLRRLGLIETSDDRHRALPLPQALALLDRSWDAFFPYASGSENQQADIAG